MVKRAFLFCVLLIFNLVVISLFKSIVRVGVNLFVGPIITFLLVSPIEDEYALNNVLPFVEYFNLLGNQVLSDSLLDEGGYNSQFDK